MISRNCYASSHGENYVYGRGKHEQEIYRRSAGRRDKLEIHYTPKHGSWLNMAEIELSVLGCQCLSRRIPDQQALRREVAAWEKARNEKEATVDWRFTTDDARIKLKRLYPSFDV